LIAWGRAVEIYLSLLEFAASSSLYDDAWLTMPDAG
jgi:hypothetical protein